VVIFIGSVEEEGGTFRRAGHRLPDASQEILELTTEPVSLF